MDNFHWAVPSSESYPYSTQYLPPTTVPTSTTYSALSSDAAQSRLNQQAVVSAGLGTTASNFVNEPTVPQPSHNQLSNTYSTLASQRSPTVTESDQPRMASSKTSLIPGQYSQHIRDTNMPTGSFASHSPPLPKFAQLGMMSTRHSPPPSVGNSTQPRHLPSVAANGIPYSQSSGSHLQPTIIQATRAVQNTGKSRIYSYEEFLRGGLDVAGQYAPSSLFHSHAPQASQPSILDHSNQSSSQHTSIASNPSQNTQNMGSGTKPASTIASFAEARVVPAVTKPSMARNSNPKHVTKLLETMKQYEIDLSMLQNASCVTPNPLAANPGAQFTTATKRASTSIESATTAPDAKRRKGKALASTHGNSQSGQKGNMIHHTQLGNMPQHSTLVAARKNGTQAFKQANGVQQPPTAKTPYVQYSSQIPLAYAACHPMKAAIDAGGTGLHPSNSIIGQKSTAPAHVKPTTSLVNPHICIEMGLQKMIELANAIKNKTMPRTEALRVMNSVRGVVERSICELHHVLSRKEDEDLAALRMVQFVTPLTYD